MAERLQTRLDLGSLARIAKASRMLDRVERRLLRLAEEKLAVDLLKLQQDAGITIARRDPTLLQIKSANAPVLFRRLLRWRKSARRLIASVLTSVGIKDQFSRNSALTTARGEAMLKAYSPVTFMRTILLSKIALRLPPGRPKSELTALINSLPPMPYNPTRRWRRNAPRAAGHIARAMP